jgi:hypothetical protein
MESLSEINIFLVSIKKLGALLANFSKLFSFFKHSSDNGYQMGFQRWPPLIHFSKETTKHFLKAKTRKTSQKTKHKSLF